MSFSRATGKGKGGGDSGSVGEKGKKGEPKKRKPKPHLSGKGVDISTYKKGERTTESP